MQRRERREFPMLRAVGVIACIIFSVDVNWADEETLAKKVASKCLN